VITVSYFGRVVDLVPCQAHRFVRRKLCKRCGAIMEETPPISSTRGVSTPILSLPSFSSVAKKLRPFPSPTNPAALVQWSDRLKALSSPDCALALSAVCKNVSRGGESSCFMYEYIFRFSFPHWTFLFLSPSFFFLVCQSGDLRNFSSPAPRVSPNDLFPLNLNDFVHSVLKLNSVPSSFINA
jgi:hypothetical protein